MPLRHDDGWWWVKADMVTPIGAGLCLDAIRDAVDRDGVVCEMGQAHG